LPARYNSSRSISRATQKLHTPARIKKKPPTMRAMVVSTAPETGTPLPLLTTAERVDVLGLGEADLLAELLAEPPIV
jgi:hypothetical protein